MEKSSYCKHNKGLLQCSLKAAHPERCVFNRDGVTLVTLAYPDRDPRDLEPNYSYHVRAMTVEALHSKSDIAAQLAWRDKEIERLTAECSRAIGDLGAS